MNWGGYVAVSDTNNPQPVVTGVSASWTVPTITLSSRNAFSAIWIGIGGYLGDNSTTLIQTGTEQDSTFFGSSYQAWYELLPGNAQFLSMPISPGDQMNASIVLNDQNMNQWNISIADVTTNQQFQTQTFYNSSQLSAEWVVENPTVNNRLRTLANFGQVNFTNCQATLDSITGAINSFPDIQIVMYQSQNIILSTWTNQLVDVSDISADGTSFRVTYLG